MYKVTLHSSVHQYTWVLLVRTEERSEALTRAEDFLREHFNSYHGADECNIKTLLDNYKEELNIAQMECLIDHTLCIIECNN